MNFFSLLSIPLAYLLGTIPSAYIIGRTIGKIDIRDEGDGRISAAAINRRVGRWPFLLVVVMDIGKAAVAVLLAQSVFQASSDMVLLAGAVAVVGHQWSPFLRLQGGLGATVIGGVLVGVATVPTLIGAACAALLVWITKRSTMSFGAAMIIISILILAIQFTNITPPPVFLVFPPPPLLVAYPLILAVMQVLKALQIKYRPGATIKVK